MATRLLFGQMNRCTVIHINRLYSISNRRKYSSLGIGAAFRLFLIMETGISSFV